MKTKKCSDCKKIKRVSKFYKNKQMISGYYSKCKLCIDSDIREYRKKHKEKYKIYYREYQKKHKDTIRQTNRQWYVRHKHDPKIKKASAYHRKIYLAKFPEKYKARNAVNNAIQSGRLKKERCEVCGAKQVHGHHEDYAKPLKVVWLCPKHHVERHHKIYE